MLKILSFVFLGSLFMSAVLAISANILFDVNDSNIKTYDRVMAFVMFLTAIAMLSAVFAFIKLFYEIVIL